MRFFKTTDVSKLFNVGAVLFIVSAIISTYYAIDQVRSLAKMASYLTALFLYYAVFYKSRSVQWMEKFFNVLIGFMFFASIYAIYQFIAEHFHTAMRITSITTHPNSFAKLLLITMPFAFVKVLAVNISNRSRYLLLGALLVMSSAMMITYSRGAWIGLFIAALLIVLVRRNPKFIALLCGFLGVGLFVVPNMMQRFLSIFSIFHPHNIQRIYGWKASLEMIRDHPFTGIGLANFKYYYPVYMDPKATEYLGHAHNIFLVFATEIGLFGLLGFVCMVLAVFIGAYKILQVKTVECNTNVYILGATASLTGTLTYGLDEYVFNNDIQLILFWVTMAYIMVVLKKRDFLLEN